MEAKSSKSLSRLVIIPIVCARLCPGLEGARGSGARPLPIENRSTLRRTMRELGTMYDTRSLDSSRSRSPPCLRGRVSSPRNLGFLFPPPTILGRRRRRRPPPPHCLPGAALIHRHREGCSRARLARLSSTRQVIFRAVARPFPGSFLLPVYKTDATSDPYGVRPLFERGGCCELRLQIFMALVGAREISSVVNHFCLVYYWHFLQRFLQLQSIQGTFSNVFE